MGSGSKGRKGSIVHQVTAPRGWRAPARLIDRPIKSTWPPGPPGPPGGGEGSTCFQDPRWETFRVDHSRGGGMVPRSDPLFCTSRHFADGGELTALSGTLPDPGAGDLVVILGSSAPETMPLWCRHRPGPYPFLISPPGGDLQDLRATLGVWPMPPGGHGGELLKSEGVS